MADCPAGASASHSGVNVTIESTILNLSTTRIEEFMAHPPYLRYCTVKLTVAVLFAMFGSGASDMVAAFSVMAVPEGAVTFTVRRTVQVVFGAMPPPWWQTILPVPPYGG